MPLQRIRFFMLALVGLFIASLGITAARPLETAGAASASHGSAHAPADVVSAIAHRGAHSALSPTGQMISKESEPNNSSATANLIVSGGVIEGAIFPSLDLDFFAFTASAGDRVYAATMTSFSAGSTDTVMELRGPDGVTVIETDDDDGSFGTLSSTIAGTVIPTSGTYFLRVIGFMTGQVLPYRLYLKVQSGSPTAEVEPNDTSVTPQPLPSSGWITGSIDINADLDFYSLALNAGDSVYISLDADPERDGGTGWNPGLGIGVFNNFILTINDASNSSPPNSEAHFMTVKEGGTYVVRVNSTTGFGTSFTYHLSVSVLPNASQASCTTYTSTDLPKALGPGTGITTSALTIPGNPRISDLNVSVALTHTSMPDLDVQLSAPPGVGGNTVGLFSDIGSTAQTVMDMILDDEAAIPANQYTVVSGLVVQPEASYRLDWFDGQDAGGTWTLTLRDDTANTSGGNLLNWGLTVCSDPPLTACPIGSNLTTVYSSDFEATDGGFTHSGTADEWEWGTPSFAPIATSNSGTNAWATDLDNTYDINSNQNLLSPAIDLSGFSGAIFVSWAQKYQMQVATLDHAFVDAQQVGGATPQRLWEWMGATMTDSVGNPTVAVQESAGWGLHYADISAFAGQQLELRFHLDSDNTVNLGGLAIDDVTVSACVGGPTPTATAVTPTATTPPASCQTYQVALNGGQEVPPNGSTATGSAAITIDTAANTLSYNITFSGLSSNELSAHIHGFAPPGSNAGALHSLPAGSPKIGVYAYNEADEANILAGLTYINIHSDNFPGGEIRGQIDGTPGGCVTPTPITPTATAITPTATTPPASCQTYQVALNGGQEVPPNGSTATGSAAITIDTAANTLSYNITFSGLSSNELSAHIHGFAPPGSNAGALHSLPAGSPKIGVYAYNEADEANILAGLTYINIHSDNFPGGEIRGQIDGTPGGCVTPTPITPTATAITPTATTPPASCQTYQVALNGGQEVPPNGSTATGSAAITIDTAANTLSYNITFSGLSSNELSAHIHGFAPPGSNAGALHSLPAGSPKIGVYAYNEADEANILAGLTYINIHSDNFPGGEIRGQIDGTPGGCVTPTATAITPTAITPTATAITPTATAITPTATETVTQRRLYLPLILR